jgi:hypothetical protein
LFLRIKRNNGAGFGPLQSSTITSNTMYFNRFDICSAHYLFACLWHGGQGCEIYAKFAQLERIGFRPSPLLAKPADLDCNAKEIFRQLVVAHCSIHTTAG